MPCRRCACMYLLYTFRELNCLTRRQIQGSRRKREVGECIHSPRRVAVGLQDVGNWGEPALHRRLVVGARNPSSSTLQHAPVAPYGNPWRWPCKLDVPPTDVTADCGHMLGTSSSRRNQRSCLVSGPRETQHENDLLDLLFSVLRCFCTNSKHREAQAL